MTIPSLAYAPDLEGDTVLHWQDDALCAQVDPEVFFPEKGGSTRSAKEICGMCPVAAECLEYALLHDERHGIWGGKSERERREIASRRSLRPAEPSEGGDVAEPLAV